MATLILAGKHKERVTLGDMFTAIHGFLRGERERFRGLITNLGFYSERHALFLPHPCYVSRQCRSSQRNGTSGVSYSRLHTILPSAARDLCRTNRTALLQCKTPARHGEALFGAWTRTHNSQADWRQSHSIARSAREILALSKSQSRWWA